MENINSKFKSSIVSKETDSFGLLLLAGGACVIGFSTFFLHYEYVFLQAMLGSLMGALALRKVRTTIGKILAILGTSSGLIIFSISIINLIYTLRNI